MPDPSSNNSSNTQESPADADVNTRRWLKIGWEIEGAWKDDQDVVASRAPCKVHGDASVTARVNDPRSQYPGRWAGELVSREPYQRLGPAMSAMLKLWPDATNESCGFHVHVSFNTGDYATLAEPAFYDYFLAQWKAWGEANVGRDGSSSEQEFWNRLNGRNRFCQKLFRPDDQMPHRDKSRVGDARYTHLNFCWSRYKTIECRMLPMFNNKELAPLAVKHLLWIYRSWLEMRDARGDQVHAVEGDQDERPTHTSTHEDTTDIAMVASTEESVEMEPDHLATIQSSGELMVAHRDVNKTQRKLAKRLAKKYPQLAQLLRDGEA